MSPVHIVLILIAAAVLGAGVRRALRKEPSPPPPAIPEPPAAAPPPPQLVEPPTQPGPLEPAPVDVSIDWYEFEDHLGAGAQGTVYRAKDKRSGTLVAIKILQDTSAGFVARLKRETDMLRALDHPGIVKLYGTGVDGERHFLVMELLDGATLDEVMKKAKIDAKQALTIAVKVAESLAHAHTHGIVHRDVKPANIMLTRDQKIKLMDFGLAKPMAKGQTLTGEGVLVGTPEFTAPELIRGERPTPACDQHSLAAMVYLLREIAGEPLGCSSLCDDLVVARRV